MVSKRSRVTALMELTFRGRQQYTIRQRNPVIPCKTSVRWKVDESNGMNCPRGRPVSLRGQGRDRS